jgi:C-terminal processing protease CtpA/Prc
MKKLNILLIIALLTGAFTFTGCEDEDDKAVPVNDFIWKGLNLYYLWKAEVPELADDRFSSQAALNSYLEGFSSPQSLFNSLLYQRNVVDRWSVLVPDFRVLENSLQGVYKSNGVEFGLVYKNPNSSEIFGYVRYILPGSDAASKDIQRGDIFYAINGTPLTETNYQDLLNNDSYTLNLADYDGGNITPNGDTVSLTKMEYAENPIYTVNVIQEGSRTIGYIMYNGFFSEYDSQLNDAFGQLASAGVTDLVLDLRYNSGGAVRTATRLASMITGQFTGQLFAKYRWNDRLQNYYESNNPGVLEEKFVSQASGVGSFNSLQLNKVYILTTRSTASASELVINCLSPYIDVVTVGTKTTGKNVASVTLYDSPDFTKNNRDGSHRYAMQPIVSKLVNKENFGEYTDGLSPDIEVPENYGNLGVLGDKNEPLLAAAIADITSQGRPGWNIPQKEHRYFKDSKKMHRFGSEMYIEEFPEGSQVLIKDLQ